MFYKNFLIFIYKKISTIYVFLLGRKDMQPINDLILSLSLDAKGFKNYGNFKKTGESNFIDLIKNEINLSLDIGANVGMYTKLLLEKTNSNIVSFEPLPEAFNELKKIEFEFSKRLKVFNLAIGENSNNLNLFYGNQKSEKASLIQNLEKLSFIKDNNINKISVEVRNLDSFYNFFKDKKIDFIKIDTEGFEYEVLKGAQKILNAHKPKFIQMEFNWHQLIRNQSLYNISKLVNSYDTFRILPKGSNLIFIEPSRPENNIYHLSNYVFIRKDISNKYK